MIYQNMGSKISVQDIDRQAEIHAKAMEIARLEKIIDELRARLEACHEGSELEQLCKMPQIIYLMPEP